MGNIELNIGGLIGAVVVGGIAAAVIFPNVDIDEGGRGPYKLFIGAIIAGAVGGTFVWAKVFPKKDADDEGDEK